MGPHVDALFATADRIYRLHATSDGSHAYQQQHHCIQRMAEGEDAPAAEAAAADMPAAEIAAADTPAAAALAAAVPAAITPEPVAADLALDLEGSLLDTMVGGSDAGNDANGPDLLDSGHASEPLVLGDPRDRTAQASEPPAASTHPDFGQLTPQLSLAHAREGSDHLPGTSQLPAASRRAERPVCRCQAIAGYRTRCCGHPQDV